MSKRYDVLTFCTQFLSPDVVEVFAKEFLVQLGTPKVSRLVITILLK
jgi:hypothetical protein